MGVLRTALYCRLSKDDMAQGDSESIKTQENICQGYFRRKKNKFSYRFIRHYDTNSGAWKILPRYFSYTKKLFRIA